VLLSSGGEEPRAVARRLLGGAARHTHQQAMVVLNHLEGHRPRPPDLRIHGSTGALDQVYHLAQVGEPGAPPRTHHETLDPGALASHRLRGGAATDPQGGNRVRQLPLGLRGQREPRITSARA
jgi:hypothetical protein